ncbi:MAG: ArnT family glycosyltransferase, partial [Candidatus Promineifilaceae bacterium]
MVDSKPSKWLSANYRLLLVGVLIIAAFLRLYALNNESPPGLEHDEVAHWLINREILNGEHGIYFSGAYGHEAAYHYLQTGFMLLLGDNAFALRLPSVFLGLLLIAVSFTLARRLFGLNTAVASAALLAVLFWPVFYSRLGLRATALPVLSGLSAYFWWRGWSDYYNQPSHLSAGQKTMSGSKGGAVPNSNGAAMLWFALCGVFAGLSFYTYMASRVVPIFFALFLIYLVLFLRSELRIRWRGVLLFFGVLVVVEFALA